MLDDDSLLELVESSNIDAGGLRFLDALFRNLKLRMALGATLDGDISAALLKFNILAPGVDRRS